MKNNSSAPSGIVLLAKQSGRTSFASLSSVKKALGTSKVGHTGTLDSFADGLLVVLSNKLTRLVPAVTEFDKEYYALIEFGSETDTLDPTGRVIKSGRIPTETEIKKILPDFTGEILQKPPAFSALHVNGERASDLVRQGKSVDIPARRIRISSLELMDFKDKYALVRVECSKGTYIRSLARDIAIKCGSCAHLKALRRTRVGPFLLEDAAGFENLGPFEIDSLLAAEAAEKEIPCTEILAKTKKMDFAVAEACAFIPVVLKEDMQSLYFNGNPLSADFFEQGRSIDSDGKYAVFTPEGNFAGVTELRKNRFSYVFVIPQEKKSEKKLRIYSWEDIVQGRFDEKVRKKGTALTIGSFDGPHLGHDSLFADCRGQKNLVPGIVTFRSGLRAFKTSDYCGDVSTLAQKIAAFEEEGFDFAVVIDFSDEFGKIQGADFLNVLADKCGMKYLSEGVDFRCGYKGSFAVPEIKELAAEKGFAFFVHSSVTYKDKKVSSSRIREDVRQALFEDVEYMLNRPYEIDCTDFKWQKCDDEYIAAVTRGIQVLPGDGEYPVTVISGSEVISGQKNTTCKLISGELRLLDFDGSLYGNVRAIQFGYPREK